MCLLICFLLNTPYHEGQAGQPFAEIKLFQKHWQFNVAATAESHQSVSSDTCLSPWIHPPHTGWEWNPPPTWWKKASQTFRLLLHNLQFNSAPKLLSLRREWRSNMKLWGPDINNAGCIHCSCKPAIFSLFLLYFHYSLQGSNGHSIITSLSPFRCKKTDLCSFSLSCSHQAT